MMILCLIYDKMCKIWNLPTHTGQISKSTSRIFPTRPVLQCPTHRDFIFFVITQKILSFDEVMHAYYFSEILTKMIIVGASCISFREINSLFYYIDFLNGLI